MKKSLLALLFGTLLVLAHVVVIITSQRIRVQLTRRLMLLIQRHSITKAVSFVTVKILKGSRPRTQ